MTDDGMKEKPCQFPRRKDKERFCSEWDVARASVLKGLGKAGKRSVIYGLSGRRF